MTEAGQGLTTRQREICDLIVTGQTSKEIGAELSISKRTVEFHRVRILKKLEVRNTVQLVRKLLGADHV